MPSILECDLFQWMPGHGENSVSTRLSESNFFVDIKYDGESENEENLKTIIFNDTVYHSVGAFPGVGVLEVAFPYNDGVFQSGCLKKLEGSELSLEWQKYWEKATGKKSEAFNHYLIFFTSANVVVHVIASGFLIQ